MSSWLGSSLYADAAPSLIGSLLFVRLIEVATALPRLAPAEKKTKKKHRRLLEKYNFIILKRNLKQVY